MEPTLISIKQVGQIFQRPNGKGITPPTVREWEAQGIIPPHIKIGKNTFWYRQECFDYIERLKEGR
ncbi:MAG: hypothetical protein WCP20_11170 [Desulfuromonadales bacterium]